ncbi:MAG: AMP-binding protein [Streptosporangiaceae bacterium]
MANLASNLVETASGLGDSVALRVGPAATTYAELDRASSRVAGMLRERGLKPGDPVGVMLPNVAEFAVIYYGVLRAGCAVVPMNPLLKAREDHAMAELLPEHKAARRQEPVHPVYQRSHRRAGESAR